MPFLSRLSSFLIYASLVDPGDVSIVVTLECYILVLLQWGAPSSAGMCPPRTPALLRGAGTTLKSAKTGAIEGSESLSSAGSGTTADRLFVQCNACASRDQRTHQTDEDRRFHGR